MEILVSSQHVYFKFIGKAVALEKDEETLTLRTVSSSRLTAQKEDPPNQSEYSYSGSCCPVSCRYSTRKGGVNGMLFAELSRQFWARGHVNHS